MRRWGYTLVWSGLVILALAMLFSFTPILWELAGRQNEDYPEYAALPFIPVGAILLLIGIWLTQRAAVRI